MENSVDCERCCVNCQSYGDSFIEDIFKIMCNINTEKFKDIIHILTKLSNENTPDAIKFRDIRQMLLEASDEKKDKFLIDKGVMKLTRIEYLLEELLKILHNVQFLKKLLHFYFPTSLLQYFLYP